MKRNIRYIVVHSTGTPQHGQVKALLNAWKEKSGSETPPYHYLVDTDGEVKKLLHENCITGNDFSHHADSIHIAYIGGVDKAGNPCDNRTGRQKAALHNKLIALSNKYPQADIVGASEENGIPNSDIKKWLAEYVPDLGEVSEDEDFYGEAA